MYCVIQKVVNKKPDPFGAYKELLVDSYTSTVNNVTKTRYTHRYSSERFERPIRDSFKIAIHHSYRENGKVLKKQWVICTMSFYELAEGSFAGDHTRRNLRDKVAEIGISENELWQLVYEKLDPLIAIAKLEFELTDEYRMKQEHEKVLRLHRLRGMKFEQKYGVGTYDYCYDVFGDSRNPLYVRDLENAYEAQQRQSNQGNHKNNYNYSDFTSLLGNIKSIYSDDEKVMLKKIYRAMSQKFHPDITKDDGEIMKLLNKLKEGWGI
jgi:hypothetical protein